VPRRDRRLVADAWNQLVEIGGDADAAGRNRAAEARDERRPSREKRRQASERFSQVDVLAAGFRLPRRQFGVCQRAGERERAAEHPHAEDRRAVRHQRRDKARRDEDTNADDVGDDDGRRVERAEMSFERGGSRADHRLSC
jgi:hypothetical protein